MPLDPKRCRAGVWLGALVSIGIAALGAWLLVSCDGAIERELSVSIANFEVLREADAARRLPPSESLAATLTFENRGSEPETIVKARLLVSADEDLGEPRSWSQTLHRDAMLRDLELEPGATFSHTFVIPWTGREETLYFPDGEPVHLGVSVTAKREGGAPETRTLRFGYVVQRRGWIAQSEFEPVAIEFASE